MKMRLKLIKIYDIDVMNRPMPRHGHERTKYNMCQSTIYSEYCIIFDIGCVI